MVRGVTPGPGGVLGPDLTPIGRDRRPEQIEQKLRDPENAAAAPAGRGARSAQLPYRAVTVRTRDGQTLRGIAKNESTFDLQLLDMDGRLHLLSKDQVAEVIREKTLMPKVEATAEEMRDLVAYLSRLTGDPNSKAILASREIGAGVRFVDIADPTPGTWPTYDGNLSGNRFSPLKQIDTSTSRSSRPSGCSVFPAPSACCK